VSYAFVAIDFETADSKRDSACAVGVARVEGAAVVYRDAVLIRPPRSVMQFTHIHGLRWSDVKDAPPFKAVWEKLRPVLDGAAALVAHNAAFDKSVLAACCEAAGHPVPTTRWVCTMKLAQGRWPKPFTNTLPEVCERLGVTLEEHHHAGADAEACARVLIALEGRGKPAEPVAIGRRPSAPEGIDPAMAAGGGDRLARLGCTAELIADAAAGRIAPIDLEKWATEYHAARFEERTKWGWVTTRTVGGA